MNESEGIESVKKPTLTTYKALMDRYNISREWALKYYNLDVNNENDLYDFIIASNSYLTLLSAFYKAFLGSDKILKNQQSIKIFANDHPIFCKIVDKILDNEKLSEDELQHIQKRINHNLIQSEINCNWTIDFEFTIDSLSFYNIYNWLRLLPINKGIIKRCELENCNKIFEIKPGGYPQKYCSQAHKMKAYRKRKINLTIL